VDEILNAKDVVFTEVSLDDAVVGKRDALLVDLAVTTLVDQLTDCLQVGLAGYKSARAMSNEAIRHLPVCDVRFDEAEHLLRRACGPHENTIVDLEEAEQLQNFTGFWGDLVDTKTEGVNQWNSPRIYIYSPSDADNEVYLGLCGHIEVTSSSGSTLQTDLVLLLVQVLLNIRLCALEDDLSLRF